jgi:hypothetical protein
VVSNGLFTVLLDFNEAAFDGNLYWLEVDVKPIDVNDFTTLTPRQEINPAPYAIYAKTSGSSTGVIKGTGTINYIAKYFDPNTLIESVIYESGGNIGIGTTSPTAKLDVNGTAKATAFVGDGSGLTNLRAGAETDPTVDANVKDGVSWSELTEIPSGFADDIDNVGSGGEDSDWTISGNDMYSAVPGNVGIGTTSPAQKLDVNGTLAVVNDGTDEALAINAAGEGAHIKFSGNPSVASPNDGDLWYTGSELNFHNGSATSNLLEERAMFPKIVRNTSRASDAASGDHAITGVGFRPKAIWIMCLIGGDENAYSSGFATASESMCMYVNHHDQAGKWNEQNAHCIKLYSGGLGNVQEASLKSMDADGFTLTWTKTGDPPGGEFIYITALCMR